MSGQDQDHNQNRHPRTSLGYNKEGKLILCTVMEEQMSLVGLI